VPIRVYRRAGKPGGAGDPGGVIAGEIGGLNMSVDIFTSKNQAAGELAVRIMTEKAVAFCHTTDPFRVYEYTVYTDDGEKNLRYAYDGCMGTVGCRFGINAGHDRRRRGGRMTLKHARGNFRALNPFSPSIHAHMKTVMRARMTVCTPTTASANHCNAILIRFYLIGLKI